jgi:hypothetical protein
VSSSNAFKVLLAVALAASVAWKIVVASEVSTDWRNGLVEFFERNHFEVALTEELVTHLPMIRADAASCRLEIAKLAPDGSDQELVRHLAMGTDRLFFVVRGRVYTQRPKFLPQIDYLWMKRLRELGLAKQVTLTIAVATNASCNAEQLPWAELRESF